jgi:hypothetical protein
MPQHVTTDRRPSPATPFGSCSAEAMAPLASVKVSVTFVWTIVPDGRGSGD